MGNMGRGVHPDFRLLGCSSYVVFPSNRYVLHLELSVSLESTHILWEIGYLHVYSNDLLLQVPRCNDIGYLFVLESEFADVYALHICARVWSNRDTRIELAASHYLMRREELPTIIDTVL